MALVASFHILCCHLRSHKFRPWSRGQFHLRSPLWDYQVQVLDLSMPLDSLQLRLE